MPSWLAVGIGGFVGAIARFQTTLWLSDWSRRKFDHVYPVGTFAVNVIGCLLIGLLMTLAIEKRISDDAQKLLITGCLGSLTTFSTFGFDTITLFRDGKPALGAVYVLSNLVVGVVAVLTGIGIGRLIIR